MYNIGQGDNIKEGGGKVFTIDYPKHIADTIYPCDHYHIDNTHRPKQIPLGSYDKKVWDDYKEYESVEPYVATNQHTKAGELSDGKILFISFVLLAIVLIYFFSKRL
jgi:hypothetical protein